MAAALKAALGGPDPNYPRTQLLLERWHRLTAAELALSPETLSGELRRFLHRHDSQRPRKNQPPVP
jgi:hypothetical protein